MTTADADFMARRRDDGERCLTAALAYLRLGWSVIPLCPADHLAVGREHGRKCKSKGKAPLVSWAEFQRRRATDAEVRGWWEKWPFANVGIVMGPISGLVGVDVDGPGGEEVLAQLAGTDEATALAFTTPGGGKRLLYLLPGGTHCQSAFKWLERKEEVRLLGHGTQTVVPPSLHASGGYYSWKNTPITFPT